MKLVLLADGDVEKNVTSYLCNNYPSDIKTIVTTSNNEIYRMA